DGAPSHGRGCRDGKDMGWRQSWVEAYIVPLPPQVGLAGQLVGYNELRPGVHAERGQIEPDRGLACTVRIEVHHDQHGVGVPLAALGETDQLRLVDVMET